MKPNNTHIGNLINNLLKSQQMTKSKLGNLIGYSTSQAVYLTTRKSIDVNMLQKIGNALKYNFFNHFPIEESKEQDGKKQDISNKEKTQEDEKKKLQDNIIELEKQIEASKRDLFLQKQEIAYLKEINELLKK